MPSFRHGKNTVVLFGSLNASPFLNEAAMSRTIETGETTAFGNLNKTYIVGLGDGTVSLSGMFDNSDNGLDAQVDANTAQANRVFTIAPSGSLDGQPAQLIQGQLTSYEITPTVGDVVTVSAEIQASGSLGSINGGKVISSSTVTPAASNTLTDVQPIDFGASANDGAIAHLHVIENTGNNTLDIRLQTAPASMGPYTDLLTFTTVAASSTTSERVEISGSVGRFARALYTSSITSGSATYTTALARK